MARREAAALVLLATALALAAWAPAAEAGTADEPEITDPSADQAAAGTVPVNTLGFASADIVAGWIEEDAGNLYFSVQVSGTGNSGTGGPYTWNFHCTAGAADLEASATSTADQPTPSGAATAATLEDSVIRLTVPRDALGGATELTGCHIEAHGGTPTDPEVAIEDVAPDDGADAGVSYQVTGGSSGGSPGDSDGDGLNDTKERQQFGNVSAQNGTGDPDQDGLNNSAEFQMGTNATDADTDGDGADDKEDPFPLDATKGGTPANATATDTDGDGLNDTWEREHFNSTTAQSGGNDPDSDGLDNAAEEAAGTDPLKADTDEDGINDAGDDKPLEPAGESAASRPELWAGSAMFAAAATFCLFGLARRA